MILRFINQLDSVGKKCSTGNQDEIGKGSVRVMLLLKNEQNTKKKNGMKTLANSRKPDIVIFRKENVFLKMEEKEK